MKLEQKLKTALNENRLLILGTQVLFGFQFNGFFQEGFNGVPSFSKLLLCCGLMLLVLPVGFLIVPSMHHRIVERGQDSPTLLSIATLTAGVALPPVAVALACDLTIAMQRIADDAAAMIVPAVIFFAVAMAAWFVLAFALKKRRLALPQEKPEATPLSAQVDQLLTEARLIIPGVQALLGFQLTITLTQAFTQLPAQAKIAHGAALCCVALAIVLLMAPASLHRIAFGGEDDPQFVRIGSLFVIAAPLPLAVAIALDIYVATGRALAPGLPVVLGAAVAVVLLGLWYAYPIGRRLTMGLGG